MKSLLKEHLEKHKFFDTLKSAIAKDPRHANLDRNAIIQKIKDEGILSDILQQLPVKKTTGVLDPPVKVQAFEAKKTITAKLFNKENLDPNRRYLAVRVV